MNKLGDFWVPTVNSGFPTCYWGCWRCWARCCWDRALAHLSLRTRARTGMDAQRRPRGPHRFSGYCILGRRGPARGRPRPRRRPPATHIGRGRAWAGASVVLVVAVRFAHSSRGRSSRGTRRASQAVTVGTSFRGVFQSDAVKFVIADGGELSTVDVPPVGVDPHPGGPRDHRGECTGAGAVHAPRPACRLRRRGLRDRGQLAAAPRDRRGCRFGYEHFVEAEHAHHVHEHDRAADDHVDATGLEPGSARAVRRSRWQGCGTRLPPPPASSGSGDALGVVLRQAELDRGDGGDGSRETDERRRFRGARDEARDVGDR